jgi:hypothetical protein
MEDKVAMVCSAAKLYLVPCVSLVQPRHPPTVDAVGAVHWLDACLGPAHQ